MSRVVYWVSPNEGEWKVHRERAAADARVFDRKEDAIDHARDLAYRKNLSQVKVQKSDGTIETEWTYGEDPHPPSG